MKPSLTVIKIILIITIIVSIGTVLGTTVYVSLLKKSPPVAVQPTPKQNIGIEDWKTYGNDKYNFEFKYPPKFIILNEEANKDAVHFREKKDHEGGLDVFVGKTNFNSINEIEKSMYDENQAAGKEYGSARYVKLQNITVNGIKSVVLKDGHTIGDWNVVSMFAHDGYLFKVGYVSSLEDLRQILSTFKFTEKSQKEGTLLYVVNGGLWQADANGKANVRLIDKDTIFRADLSPDKSSIAYRVHTKVRDTVTTHEGKKEDRDFTRYDLLLADRKGANSYTVKNGVMRWGWVPSTDLLWYESSELGQFMDWDYLGNNDVWIYDAKNKKSSLMAKDEQMLGMQWSFDGNKLLYVGYKKDKAGQFKNLSLSVVDRDTLAKKDLFDVPYVGGDRGGPPPIPSFYWDKNNKFIYTAFTPLVWDKNDDLHSKFKSGYLTGWKISVDGSEAVKIFPDVPSSALNDESYPEAVFNEDFSEVAYTRYKEEDIKGLEPNNWFYRDISKPLSLVVYDMKSQKEKVLIEDIRSNGGIKKVWYYPRDKNNKEIFFRDNYLYVLAGEKKQIQNQYEFLLTLKKIDITTAESQDSKLDLTAKTGNFTDMDDVGYSKNLNAVYFNFGDKVYYFLENKRSFEKIIDGVRSVNFYL